MKKTNKFLKRLVFGSLLALTGVGTQAQEPIRPVLSAYTVEIGSSHIADTYLSPLKYSGGATALNYERMQAMEFSPEKWVMRLNARAAFNWAKNTVRNASMLDLDIDIRWGMMHRWRMPQGFILMAGASTGVAGGTFYNARNSNNPASAKASWTVNASGSAVWNGSFHGIPLCARYLVEMPLTGIFFYPEYGELYYEIYLGNHSGLVHGAWPGNFFRLENLATVDMRFGGTIVRLGYRGNVLSTKACGLVTRRVTHTLVIGLASEWLTLSARKNRGIENARIISALY